jgi:hypothetical protein
VKRGSAQARVAKHVGVLGSLEEGAEARFGRHNRCRAPVRGIYRPQVYPYSLGDFTSGTLHTPCFNICRLSVFSYSLFSFRSHPVQRSHDVTPNGCRIIGLRGYNNKGIAATVVVTSNLSKRSKQHISYRDRDSPEGEIRTQLSMTRRMSA